MTIHVPKFPKLSAQFLFLAIFLGIVFGTGGSSRGDTQSLAALWPASITICAIAIFTLNTEQLRQNRMLVSGMGAVIILSLAHLIPVSPREWHALPQYSGLQVIDEILDIKAQWRPITLSSNGGLQSLFALVTPLAVLLLGIQLSTSEKFYLLPLIIGFAVISGIIGLFQIIGAPNGQLYFYRITNNGSAVGLFANRNHAAVLLACLFPMLAVLGWSAGNSPKKGYGVQFLCAAIAIVLVPLILVTGSRSGLLMGLVGLVSAAFLYHRPTSSYGNKSRSHIKMVRIVQIVAGLLIIALGYLTAHFSRAEALDRLIGPTLDDGGRSDVVIIAIDMLLKYFPWGSGSGSFVEAYQTVEPDRLLDSTYLNRAHNDWIEIAVTLGLPGIIITFTGLLWYFSTTVKIWRERLPINSANMLARMAGVIIGIVGLASISDYPLRTPIFMSVMSIAVVWLGGAVNEHRIRS